MPGIPTRKGRDLPGVAAGVTMSVIFGLSFLCTKVALGSLSPLDLLSLRFIAAAVVMAVMAGCGLIRLNLSGGRWLRLLPLAAVQPVIYFICETAGIKLTSASEAGVIIGSIPAVVAVMAAFFLRERPGILQLLFIVACCAGVAVMAAKDGFSREHLAGFLYLLGAVLSAGVYSILSRSQSRQFKPIEITTVMMWTGAAVFTLFSLADHYINHSPSFFSAPFTTSAWLAILYLGLLSSVGAFFLMNFMLGRMEAARTVAYTNLTSVVSVAAGVIFLGEDFQWYQGFGAILVLLGVWGSNRFSRKPQAGHIVESAGTAGIQAAGRE